MNMVFVDNLNLWLGLSLAIAFFSMFKVHTFYELPNLDKLNSLVNTFIVFSLLSLFIFHSFFFILVFLISIMFKLFAHQSELALSLEKALARLVLPYRTSVFQKLSNENYTITHWTLHNYIYSFFNSEVLGFNALVHHTLEDMRVGFFLNDPVDSVTQEEYDAYSSMLSYFKYTVLPEPKLLDLSNPEDFANHKSFWEKASNPKLNFVLVSHLPINLNYSMGSSILFSALVSHTAVFYSFFNSTIISLLLMIVYFIYTVFFFKIQFLKQLSVWFVIGMIYFWLMSGFNFFLNSYQFGKFTSQIQSFWKRTNTCFWLIEGFLILLFFYYFLNSSQEPIYMYDYSALNQEYLVSLQSIAVNIVVLSVVIYFMYFVLLRVNSNSWQQLNFYLIIISAFIFFSFFIETYQFYYVISTFNERLWIFNEDENLWQIDTENPILRTKQDYLLVCLIANYWHFLFIFLSWVFFLINSFERSNVTYVLFGANLQNILILYVLNFACYLQWFKWVYSRFFDLPYTWFMTNIDNSFFTSFFFELRLIASNLTSIVCCDNTTINILVKSINIWNVDSLAIWNFI